MREALRGAGMLSFECRTDASAVSPRKCSAEPMFEVIVARVSLGLVVDGSSSTIASKCRNLSRLTSYRPVLCAACASSVSLFTRRLR